MFSTAGQRKGFDDKRGNVFWRCLEVIEKKQPKYFILENVKGLLHHDKGRTWKVIWDEMSKLEWYNVKWKVLNTKDYGIPQNRERVFIVGTKGEFEWPEKVKMNDLADYVDLKDTILTELTSERYKNYISKLPEDAIYVDLAFCGMPGRKHTKAHEYAGCLHTRGSLWCHLLNRYANQKELLWLQGFDENFNISVSRTQLCRQLGNSMSVNVLSGILSNLV